MDFILVQLHNNKSKKLRQNENSIQIQGTAVCTLVGYLYMECAYIIFQITY